MADLAVVDLDNDRPGYRPDGKAAPRWQPDLQLVPAMLTVPRWPKRLTDYEPSDRSWIVAGLTLAGWSAEEITERIGGSIRLIRDIRSQPMTSLCTMMHEEIEKLTKELRLSQIDCAATQHALAQAAKEAERFKTQRDQVLRVQKTQPGKRVEQFACGCPKIERNIYRNKRGREYCRECGRIRLARYRDKKRSA
ncbi:hypothetical protein [Mycolicibacterium canariasense]|uniref:hypothetical protein n=1 Tax=Mycolicibacterium canariasense TaxID=228230 RepID=UPI00104266D2|nr:hypothetical protein [Mycolicibacterium canariasense]